MIVSANPISRTPHWLRAVTLLCAVVLLPLGQAFAQEPDYEAVGERLIKAVEAGELTPEQASAMMGELARASFARRMAAASSRRSRRGPDAGIGGHFLEMGVSEGTFDRIRKALAESGFKGKQMEGALGAMHRLTMGSKVDRFEPDQRVLSYLKDEIGLSREQIGLVLELSQRLVHGLEYRARILAAVKAGEMSREDAGKKLDAIGKQLFGGRGAQAKRGSKRVTREDYARADRSTDAKLEAVKKKIWAGVKAGKLTEKQAKERWEAYLKSVRGSGSKRKRRGDDDGDHDRRRR